MKQTTIKHFLVFTMAMVCAQCLAYYDISARNSDGKLIYYKYINGHDELAVTAGITKYSGYIIIPSYVEVSGVSKRVTAIGEDAFLHNTNLTHVDIPNTVTSIEESAFYGCTGLNEITLPYNLKTIGNSAFSGCKNLSIKNIPNTVTSIGEYAFLSCI